MKLINELEAKEIDVVPTNVREVIQMQDVTEFKNSSDAF